MPGGNGKPLNDMLVMNGYFICEGGKCKLDRSLQLVAPVISVSLCGLCFVDLVCALTFAIAMCFRPRVDLQYDLRSLSWYGLLAVLLCACICLIASDARCNECKLRKLLSG